jgi:hypothetical protein
MTRYLGKLFVTWKIGAKTPKTVACEIRRKITREFGLSDKYAKVFSPEESTELGLGGGWSVCIEDGPFEWAIWLSLHCQSLYEHPTVFAECFNGYVINLYPRKPVRDLF